MSENFEVAEYTLPLISAKLTVPKRVIFSDRKIPVTIEASYAFGGDVKGTATVVTNFNDNNPYKKVIEIESGSASFEIDMKENLQMRTERSGTVEISLTFNDPLTHTTVKDSASVYISEYKYNIDITADPFVPGTPFNFNVKVTDFEQKPAPAGTKVEVSFKNPDTIPPRTLTLDSDGSATSTVNIPPNEPNFQIMFSTNDAYKRIFRPRYVRTPKTKPDIDIVILNKE